MDNQSGPVQTESNPPITQGLQHVPTERPAWAETAGRVMHHLMIDFGGGRWLKLAWVINFQKLATIPLLAMPMHKPLHPGLRDHDGLGRAEVFHTPIQT